MKQKKFFEEILAKIFPCMIKTVAHKFGGAQKNQKI